MENKNLKLPLSNRLEKLRKRLPELYNNVEKETNEWSSPEGAIIDIIETARRYQNLNKLKNFKLIKYRFIKQHNGSVIPSRHYEICRKAGFDVPYLVYFNDKHNVPFERAIQSRVKSKYGEILKFISTQVRATVRQIFYHLVILKIIKNSLNSYKALNRTITRLRLGGLIPMDSIIDITNVWGTQQYNSIEEPVKMAIDNYRSKWWEDQDYYIDVWLEKRALENLVYPVTNKYGVFLSVAGGEPKWSQVNTFKNRITDKTNKEIIILLLTDFDPKGDEMVDTLGEMLETLHLDNVTVKKIALNPEQVTEYNLPKSMDFKKGDRCLSKFIKKYGIDYYVELDALTPTQLQEIVEKSILDVVNLDLLKKKQIQDEGKKREMYERLELEE